MQLQESLGLEDREMICAVGGGGKTTILFNLGKELIDSGETALLTTTTKIYVPEQQDVLTLVKSEADFVDMLDKLPQRRKLPVWGSGIYKQPKDKDKLLGVNCDTLDYLFCQNPIDYILIEADGAKKKPIKTPGHNEPCIPKNTTIVLGVIGMDAIGKTLNEDSFHRVNVFLKENDFQPNSKIDIKVIATLVNWEQGLFKNTPSTARRLLVLNKVDDSYRYDIAKKIANKVLTQKSGIVPEKIILSSFLREKPILNVF